MIFNLRLAVATCLAVTAIAASASAAPIRPLRTIPVGKLPGLLAANPATHRVFVVNQGSNSVSIIDTLTLKVVKTIAVGAAPLAIAANPSANLVYVANTGDGTISAISGASTATLWHIGGKSIALAVDVALNRLYVADATQNQIEVLNAKSGASITSIPLLKTPTALAIDIATHRLWVACTGASGSAIVIDGNTNSIVKTIKSLAANISSVSVDPMSGVAVMVSPTANAYIAINPANNYSVNSATGDTGADPIATAYDPGEDSFFFMDSGDGYTYFADGTGLIHLGNSYGVHLSGGSGIAIDTATNQMGLDYTGADTSYLIDLQNPLFTQNYHYLAPGHKPDGLVFDPLANRLFISNKGDNTVAVFDNSPQTVTAASECSCGGNGITYNFIDTNPATGTIYTLRLGNLYAIDEAAAGAGTSGSTDGVTAIALASGYSSAVAANPATNKIYVGDSQGSFYSVNGATNTATLITSVPATADIRSLAVDAARNEIVAWDYHSNIIDVLDSTTDALLHAIPLTTTGNALVTVDSAKDRAYVASNEVTVINPSKGTVVATVPLGALTSVAQQVALNPADSRLYVYSNDNNVYVFDTVHNSVVTSIAPVGFHISSVGVNPLTGLWYVGGSSSSDNAYHVLVYDGASNSLKKDLSSAANPAISYSASIVANPLTDTVYVGDYGGSSTGAGAVIDGRTSAISALVPSSFEFTAYALAVDLGSNLLAGAGYSYTNLWFPTTDMSGTVEVPIAVRMTGIPDAGTIATSPIFRTHTTNPSFTLSATSKFTSNTAALAPTSAYWQVDGWQGKWTSAALKAKAGSKTAHATIALPALSTGQHILYAYAATGDVATVQDSRVGGNSSVNSRIASVVFTVEK